MRIYALTAAYNEESTIVGVIEDELKHVDKVIFVNDGSTDRTLEKVQSRFSRNKNVEIISWDSNKGKGYALIQGFKKFLNSDGDILVTLDGDGQHDASQMSSVILPIEKHLSDVVVGARILTESPSRIRIFFNAIVNIVMLLTTGSLFVDVSSGFRAYSRNTIKKILPYLSFYDFAIEPQILRACVLNKLKFATISINVNYKKGRKSNIWRLARSYIRYTWKYKGDIIRKIVGRKVIKTIQQ